MGAGTKDTFAENAPTCQQLGFSRCKKGHYRVAVAKSPVLRVGADFTNTVHNTQPMAILLGIMSCTCILRYLCEKLILFNPIVCFGIGNLNRFDLSCRIAWQGGNVTFNVYLVRRVRGNAIF